MSCKVAGNKAGISDMEVIVVVVVTVVVVVIIIIIIIIIIFFLKLASIRITHVVTGANCMCQFFHP